MLSSNEVAERPKLAYLLDKINSKTLVEGSQLTVGAKVAASNAHVKESKRKYLMSKLVLDTLKDTIESFLTAESLGRDLQACNLTCDARIYQIANHLLAVEEAGQLLETPLPCDGTPEGTKHPHQTLLGLSKDHLLDVCHDPKLLPVQHESLRNNLTPEVEMRLRRKCEAIASFLEPPMAMVNSGGAAETAAPPTSGAGSTAAALLPLNRSLHLAEDVEDLLKNVKLEETEVERKLEELMRLQGERVNKLSKTLYLVTEILQNFRLGQHRTMAVARCQWLQAFFRTLQLKVARMTLVKERETYSREAVAGLRVIGRELDHRVDSIAQRLATAEAELRAYRDVGGGFQKLAEEHGRITAQIEEKQKYIGRILGQDHKLREEEGGGGG